MQLQSCDVSGDDDDNDDNSSCCLCNISATLMAVQLCCSQGLFSPSVSTWRMCSLCDWRLSCRSVDRVAAARRRRPKGLRRAGVAGGATSRTAWPARWGVVNLISWTWSPTTLFSLVMHGNQRNARRNPLRNLFNNTKNEHLLHYLRRAQSRSTMQQYLQSISV